MFVNIILLQQVHLFVKQFWFYLLSDDYIKYIALLDKYHISKHKQTHNRLF